MRLSQDEIGQLLAGLDSLVRNHKDSLGAAEAVLPLARKLRVLSQDPETEPTSVPAATLATPTRAVAAAPAVDGQAA